MPNKLSIPHTLQDKETREEKIEGKKTMKLYPNKAKNRALIQVKLDVAADRLRETARCMKETRWCRRTMHLRVTNERVWVSNIPDISSSLAFSLSTLDSTTCRATLGERKDARILLGLAVCKRWTYVVTLGFDICKKRCLFCSPIFMWLHFPCESDHWRSWELRVFASFVFSVVLSSKKKKQKMRKKAIPRHTPRLRKHLSNVSMPHISLDYSKDPDIRNRFLGENERRCWANKRQSGWGSFLLSKSACAFVVV